MSSYKTCFNINSDFIRIKYEYHYFNRNVRVISKRYINITPTERGTSSESARSTPPGQVEQRDLKDWLLFLQEQKKVIIIRTDLKDVWENFKKGPLILGKVTPLLTIQGSLGELHDHSSLVGRGTLH